MFYKIKVDWPKIIHVDTNLTAISSRDKVLQDKESTNVCTETLTDDLASTVAKVRAVQYTNRGSIPRKGKEYLLLRNVRTSSGAHAVS
jgi:hypothetical protein